MITYTSGDLFQSSMQVLVNPVNTVGIMGEGLALAFKKRFPAMYEEYRAMCQRREFAIGNLWLYEAEEVRVLNFPTKRHWRNPSKTEYIEAGLATFQAQYVALGIESIAFPALGCGHGGLDFEAQVRPLMETYLSDLPIEVIVFRPR